jgi:hypothetical protein
MMYFKISQLPLGGGTAITPTVKPPFEALACGAERRRSGYGTPESLSKKHRDPPQIRILISAEASPYFALMSSDWVGPGHS